MLKIFIASGFLLSAVSFALGVQSGPQVAHDQASGLKARYSHRRHLANARAPMVQDHQPTKVKRAVDTPWPLNSPVAQQSGPIFTPLSTSAPPSSYFGTGTPHPRQPVNIAGNPTKVPIGTNKWYNQLLLPPTGTDPIYPLPYAVAFTDGQSLLSAPGARNFVGVAISHADASRRVFDSPTSNPAAYYYNPLELAMVFGANEIAASGSISGQLSRWSELAATFTVARAGIAVPTSATSRISFPISRGAAFFTAQYSNLTPIIRSGLAITNFAAATSVNGYSKWYVSYNDNSNWLVYAAPKSGSSSGALRLAQANQTDITSSQGSWTGVIQVTKLPTNWQKGGAIEALFDKSVGVWITGATITGGYTAGTYSFTWGTEGSRASSVAPLVYGLIHHTASLSVPSGPTSPLVQLNSRSSGAMTLYQAAKWSFNETASYSTVAKYSVLPVNPTFPAQSLPTASDLAVLRNVAMRETSIDFSAESNAPGSYYFSGKKLAKQALQCLTVSQILKNTTLTQTCVQKAEASFLQFVNGVQAAPPLIYDSTWKGITSKGYIQTGDENADFGNGVYNDHHFQFGYFVHAAAVLTKLDPSFRSKVESWVTSLIRDVSNPSTSDSYFPFSRNFDFYAGHLWASGLQSVLDGKNEESSSEDANFFYGLKTWAEVTSNTSLLSLANLQLAILRRSINTYYLMTNSNTAQPSNYLRNRVVGILYENKCTYTTFFSQDKDAIQMIQNIPISPITPFMRDLTFVARQWTDSGPTTDPPSNEVSVLATTRSNGYRTLLYDQYAVLQPRQILNGVISNTSLPVDDGSSVTWNLGFAISQLGKTGGK